ncbi:MAG: hypothetical protein K2K91_09740 [Ruminococcus sp.]|nr:hypothetical protein [Ruminococcus sp.]MDE7098332.1 hypothetical protein [Ruminococcus sp.]
MKKIIIAVIVVIFLSGGFFGYKYFSKIDVTDSSKWEYVYNDEFIAKLPENMKESDNLFYTSTGEKQIALYQNSEVCFSVAKIPFSANESLKTIDIKTFCKNLEINGKKLDIIPINDGYYYTTDREAENIFENTSSIFSIEGIFKDDDAIYSVVIQCRKADKTEYESSMIEWLESFRLK